MNLVVTYLVLLAGTGADHRFTKWSAKAISEHTGMRKDAAKRAIAELIDADLVERADSWTAKFPHHNLFCFDEVDEEGPIFLPVGLVTGVTDSDASMLRRMRETGDVLALRLAIDLYGQVTTDAPYAVAVPAMRTYNNGEDTAEKIHEAGAHAVWDLKSRTVSQSKTLDRSRYVAKGEPGTKFWDRVGLLQTVGVTYLEPWLCSAANEDADLLFPMTTEVAEFAGIAADALLSGGGEREWKVDDYADATLVVLPVHFQTPALVWLTKMRIEADTPGRRGAYGERQRIAAHWIEQYDRLTAEAEAGIYANPLRTQPPRASDDATHDESVPIKGIKDHQGSQGHQLGGDHLSKAVKSERIGRLAAAA